MRDLFKTKVYGWCKTLNNHFVYCLNLEDFSKTMNGFNYDPLQKLCSLDHELVYLLQMKRNCVIRKLLLFNTTSPNIIII